MTACKANMGEQVHYDFSAQRVQQQLEAAMIRLAVLQKEHLEAASAGRLESVFSWRTSRENVFRQLQFLFQAAMRQKDTLDREFLYTARCGLQDLLRAEEELRLQVSRTMAALKGQMESMRKGKKALNGYSVQGSGMRPKFLSNKM